MRGNPDPTATLSTFQFGHLWSCIGEWHVENRRFAVGAEQRLMMMDKSLTTTVVFPTTPKGTAFERNYPLTLPEMRRRQKAKIEEIRNVLATSGLVTLDQQAKALTLPRSTTWNLLKGNHKGSGLSASVVSENWRHRDCHLPCVPRSLSVLRRSRQVSTATTSCGSTNSFLGSRSVLLSTPGPGRQERDCHSRANQPRSHVDRRKGTAGGQTGAPVDHQAFQGRSGVIQGTADRPS
jgi:hypothetical protein